MYEVKAKVKKIDDVPVEIFSRDIVRANILHVEAGSTGYCGGDSGHGGRTYFSIFDESSTDIEVKLIENQYGNKGFEVILAGDSELDTTITALEFILKALKDARDNKE